MATLAYRDISRTSIPKQSVLFPPITHGMKKEVEKFVYAFLSCPKSKIENQKAMGLMQPLCIPEWKWDNVSINFVSSLPKTAKGINLISVIVDRLTKSAHFLPMKIDHLMEMLSEMYVNEIVKLHGMPSSIVSDRDLRFTLKFWTGSECFWY